MRNIISLFTCLLLVSCNSERKKHYDPIAKSDSFKELSHYYFNTNNLDSAQYFITQALFFDPASWAAYNDRACLKFKQNKPKDEVVADFEISLRIKPGYETALLNLAIYYNEIKDYKNALKTCIRYSSQNDSINPEHIKLIDSIRLKAQSYEKLVGNVTAQQVIMFYDSIEVIVHEALPVQQRLIDQLVLIQTKIAYKKYPDSEVAYADKLFDSAKIATQIEFERINTIDEIDSAINFKNTVINCILGNKTTGESNFSRYLICLKTKNLALIKNCMASLSLELTDIRKAQKKMEEALANLKAKYHFDVPEKDQ